MFFLRPENGVRGRREHAPQPFRKEVSMKLTKVNIAKVAVPHGKSEHIEI